MGADGSARDGFARPGCQCRACDVTNTRNTWDGTGANRALEQEQFSTGKPLWPAYLGRDLETAMQAHQNHAEGV